MGKPAPLRSSYLGDCDGLEEDSSCGPRTVLSRGRSVAVYNLAADPARSPTPCEYVRRSVYVYAASICVFIIYMCMIIVHYRLYSR